MRKDYILRYEVYKKCTDHIAVINQTGVYRGDFPVNTLTLINWISQLDSHYSADASVVATNLVSWEVVNND